MCLITFSRGGAENLDWRTLDYSAVMNSDGFGGAWFDGQVWNTWRSVRAHKHLKKALARIPQDAPVMVHQRYATHGAVVIANAHPFALARGVLLAHNGCISGTRADARLSDTRAYVDYELSPLIEAAGVLWMHHAKGREAMAARVGQGSVLMILLPGEAEPIIVNERQGAWDGDIFYSNAYSLPGKLGYGASDYGSGYGSMYSGNYDWDDAPSAAQAVSEDAYGRIALTWDGDIDNQDYTPPRVMTSDAGPDEWDAWLEEGRTAYTKKKRKALR